MQNETQASWWLNQPIWKNMRKSRWMISPGRGKNENVWNHHLACGHCTYEIQDVRNNQSWITPTVPVHQRATPNPTASEVAWNTAPQKPGSTSTKSQNPMLPKPKHCHTSQCLNSNISSNRCLRHRSKRSKDMQRSRTSQRCRVVCKDCLKPWQETTKHLESEVLPCLWWPWCRHGVAMVFPMGSAPWHN